MICHCRRCRSVLNVATVPAPVQCPACRSCHVWPGLAPAPKMTPALQPAEVKVRLRRRRLATGPGLTVTATSWKPTALAEDLLRRADQLGAARKAAVTPSPSHLVTPSRKGDR